MASPLYVAVSVCEPTVRLVVEKLEEGLTPALVVLGPLIVPSSVSENVMDPAAKGMMDPTV